jgi:hypothetical protein
MNIDFREIVTATMVLFAVIDIVGSIPIIIDLRTRFGHIQSEKASIVSAVIMISFLFVGEEILKLIESKKFKRKHIPETEKVIFSISGKTIGCSQSFVCFQGMPKNGKSLFITSGEIFMKYFCSSILWVSVFVPIYGCRSLTNSCR